MTKNILTYVLTHKQNQFVVEVDFAHESSFAYVNGKRSPIPSSSFRNAFWLSWDGLVYWIRESLGYNVPDSFDHDIKLIDCVSEF